MWRVVRANRAPAPLAGPGEGVVLRKMRREVHPRNSFRRPRYFRRVTMSRARPAEVLRRYLSSSAPVRRDPVRARAVGLLLPSFDPSLRSGHLPLSTVGS